MTDVDSIEGVQMRLRMMPPPSNLDKCRRFLWLLVEATLYRWSPVPMNGWRCMLLRLFGARVGALAHPYPSAKIWAPWNLEMGDGSCLGPGVTCYSVSRIKLDSGAIVSQGAHLCAATRDHRDPAFGLMGGDIEIGRHAWVAAEAFIGPGIIVGERAVVGARTVVFKDVPSEAVMVGNPACVVERRSMTAP